MSRTVTALFDSRSEADAAKTRLTQSSIDADNVRIIDQSSAGSSSGSDDHKGFFDAVKDFFMPDEDAHAYSEGIRRGGYMLTAQVDEDQADEAIRILDESNSVDFDKRQDEWRSKGWTGLGTGASPQGSVLGNTAGRFDSDSGRDTVDEERIPIVEEELKVGKREVERGGARVRSYVREVPVHDQVSLREEHVSVERRPVDEKLSAGDRDDLFQDRTIEMTEIAEEAVVAKEARVTEELVVRKTAEEHVEDIDDTVRRTEVDVDEDRGSGDRSAFGFDKDKGSSDTERSDFERTGSLGTDRSRY